MNVMNTLFDATLIKLDKLDFCNSARPSILTDYDAMTAVMFKTDLTVLMTAASVASPTPRSVEVQLLKAHSRDPSRSCHS